MAPALAQFNCRVIQSTSDEAPGLLAYVEHYLEAHHSPDLFHVQHELVKAVSGPMAIKERAAQKAVSEATEQLVRLQSDPQSAGDETAKHRPGRAPKDPAQFLAVCSGPKTQLVFYHFEWHSAVASGDAKVLCENHLSFNQTRTT